MSQVIDPINRFYHDVPSSLQQEALKLLKKQPIIASLTAPSNAIYLNVPSTYLYCKDDRLVTYKLQNWMVQNAKLLGWNVDERYCDAGKSLIALLSMLCLLFVLLGLFEAG